MQKCTDITSQNFIKILKHFHSNNSIYKILTTPSYGLKKRYCLS